MSNFVLSVYSIWLHTVYVILTLSILILLFFSFKEHKVYLPWSKKQPWIIQKYLYFHFNIWGAYVLIWLKNIIRNEIFVVQYDCKWDFAWLLLAIECQRYFHWFNEPLLPFKSRMNIKVFLLIFRWTWCFSLQLMQTLYRFHNHSLLDSNAKRKN